MIEAIKMVYSVFDFSAAWDFHMGNGSKRSSGICNFVTGASDAGKKQGPTGYIRTELLPTKRDSNKRTKTHQCTEQFHSGDNQSVISLKPANAYKNRIHQ